MKLPLSENKQHYIPFPAIGDKLYKTLIINPKTFILSSFFVMPSNV